MFNTIEDYLAALKVEMRTSDPAVLQDALADAREHLSAALATAREANAELTEAQALPALVEAYGTPQETAAAYLEVERRTSPVLKPTARPRSWLGRFFGVYIDPRTWGSLLFMFITFVTGILYFTWAVTGTALSLSLLILIIGVPFAILFLLSAQGLALLEGRLVEALLGVRMPRRPAFAQPGLKWGERLKALLGDKHTWLSLLYMVLQLPLGIIYFTLSTTFLALSLGLMAAPAAQLFFAVPLITLNLQPYYLPGWSLILISLGGCLALTLSLHLTRGLGWLHARYAKALLVS